MRCSHIKIFWEIKDYILLLDSLVLLPSLREMVGVGGMCARSLDWRLRVCLYKAQSRGLPRTKVLQQSQPSELLSLWVEQRASASKYSVHRVLTEGLLCARLLDQIRASLLLVCCTTQDSWSTCWVPRIL